VLYYHPTWLNRLILVIFLLLVLLFLLLSSVSRTDLFPIGSDVLLPPSLLYNTYMYACVYIRDLLHCIRFLKVYVCVCVGGEWGGGTEGIRCAPYL
jgi:hypothetical protein